MSFESLKARILESLTSNEKVVRQSTILLYASDPEPLTKQQVDEHRKSAHGQIDIYLEANIITPEEAENRKAKWDVMHGY